MHCMWLLTKKIKIFFVFCYFHRRRDRTYSFNYTGLQRIWLMRLSLSQVGDMSRISVTAESWSGSPGREKQHIFCWISAADWPKKTEFFFANFLIFSFLADFECSLLELGHFESEHYFFCTFQIKDCPTIRNALKYFFGWLLMLIFTLIVH